MVRNSSASLGTGVILKLTRVYFSVALLVLTGSIGVAGEEPPTPLEFGGVGGVYILAEPGELWIEVAKRDLHRTSRTTDMRLILAGPDRQVLGEKTISDDGLADNRRPGPLRGERLTAQVPRRGVYALNVTVSQDRYGDDIAWTFRTNAKHYLIETSGGHRDERHQEPIRLLSADRPGDVCFLPRRGDFAIDVSALPSQCGPLVLYDDGNRVVATLTPAGGRATATVPAAENRGDKPWRLHLPQCRGTVEIDGVTRWEAGDPYPNLCCWTPQQSSYYPLLAYRWLITPYSRTVYGRTGQEIETSFRVHNNSPREITVDLSLEFPQSPWSVALSQRRITLAARQGREIAVRLAMPQGEGPSRCHIRATPDGSRQISTYATLQVRPGDAPAGQPLALPLVLSPYRHENEQFGYLADYPRDGEFYFDMANRPVTVSSGRIVTTDAGKWQEQTLSRPWSVASNRIAFDAQGALYTMATAGPHLALLRSADQGKTVVAAIIAGREKESRSWDIEQFSGHNALSGPPPVIRVTRTGMDPKLRWRRVNDLELFAPSWDGKQLVIGQPVLLSQNCIGLSGHSGVPSSIVSRGEKIHVAWAEATDPAIKAPGVPVYVSSYDRQTGAASKPALVGYGPPANDVHNTPSITMDSRGYLHVIVGTHGQPFLYCRSLAPNDAAAGWTKAEPTGTELRQTYIGLVCGPDDTLYLAFRLWRGAEAPFPSSTFATLAFQRKPPGKPWQEPQILVVPPFSEYSVYYHRLTIDRAGRLFLSYDYWSTFWFYRNDHMGSRRSLLSSADGGLSWKLATTGDMVGQ